MHYTTLKKEQSWISVYRRAIKLSNCGFILHRGAQPYTNTRYINAAFDDKTQYSAYQQPNGLWREIFY